MFKLEGTDVIDVYSMSNQSKSEGYNSNTTSARQLLLMSFGCRDFHGTLLELGDELGDVEVEIVLWFIGGDVSCVHQNPQKFPEHNSHRLQ